MSLKRSAYTVTLPFRKISPFSVIPAMPVFDSLPNSENNKRKVLSRRPSSACYSDRPDDFFLMRSLSTDLSFVSLGCDYVHRQGRPRRVRTAQGPRRAT